MLLLPITNDTPVIAINPFCADAIQKSILSFLISIGLIAYVDVVSTTKTAPYRCTSAPISRTGFKIPVPVSLCVVYTSAISLFSFSTCSISSNDGLSSIGNSRLMNGIP